jgi:hypothetical protein
VCVCVCVCVCACVCVQAMSWTPAYECLFRYISRHGLKEAVVPGLQVMRCPSKVKKQRGYGEASSKAVR